MQIIKLTTAVLLVLLLTACADRKETKPIASCEDETVPSEAKEIAEAHSREAIFIYGKQADLKRVVLKLSGEPLLLASGYIHLAGVVWGEEPVALVEVGGRGLAIKEGEGIDAYRVNRINSDSVVLEKKS